jgi:hypothetical protein
MEQVLKLTKDSVCFACIVLVIRTMVTAGAAKPLKNQIRTPSTTSTAVLAVDSFADERRSIQDRIAPDST